MSTPSIHTEKSTASDGEQSGNRSDRLAVSTLTRPFEAAAFWSAVALPFLYLPLLVAGLDSSAQLSAFLALLALHAVAIVGGHRHNRQ
ncbi:hypothetical protein [Halalkalicoccus subterraneus]|uniref:hypothetical protein n=1 Tax=Halalkalicoccus subterraneus TaxID=2675002 RepID=UPI000EFC7BD5|nr:hypothetical protein [Halalkalicoccus subterraneus]